MSSELGTVCGSHERDAMQKGNCWYLIHYLIVLRRQSRKLCQIFLTFRLAQVL
jgi:hypothetical protein